MKTHDDKYHYRECGLDFIYLSNGFEWHETPYGKALSITDVEGLHQLIGMALIEKPAPLTGAEFRFLRTELDLSQEGVGLLLGRKVRQIRGYETADEVPEPANTLIRFVYKERLDPSETFEHFSRAIAELQKFDKAVNELKLRATAHGWEPAEACA
jgi:DNA-binding transcriptional regulator YiaG